MESEKENVQVLRDDGKRGTKPDAAAATTKTPSKARCSLGTPSAYYFKYMNSTSKKRRNDTSILGDDITGEISIPGISFDNKNLTETSFMSIGESSSGSEESDLLNKSTLSDTTELTASNFVLAATSRQRFRKLSKLEPKVALKARSDKKEEPATKTMAKDVLKSSTDESGVSILNQGQQESQALSSEDDSKLSAKQDSKASMGSSQESNDGVPSPPQRNDSIRGASPSLRSRISASPRSLRHFSESLKKSRIQREIKREEYAKRRLSSGNDTGTFSLKMGFSNEESKSTNRKLLPPPMTQPSPCSEHFMKEFMSSPNIDHLSLVSSRKSTADYSVGVFDATKEHKREEDIELSIMDTKGSIGRTSANESAKKVQLEQDWENSSEISSVVQNEKSTQVLSSPEGSRLNKAGIPLDIEFKDALKGGHKLQVGSKNTTGLENSPPRSNHKALRLTSGSKKKLTPSGLASPARRILNPRSVDSPARNTRSAKKKRLEEFEDTGSISLNPGISLLNLSIPEDADSPSSEPSLSQPEPAALFRSPQTEESSIGKAKDEDAEHAKNADTPGTFQEPNSVLSQTSIGSIERPTLQSDQKQRQSEGDTASISDIADILGLDKEMLAMKNPPNIDRFSLSTGFGKRQSQGDTASFGDIADILGLDRDKRGSAKRDQSPSSLSNEYAKRRSLDDTASIGDIDVILGLDRKAQAETGLSRTGETPPLSSKCHRRLSLGDTASIGDIDDILGSDRKPQDKTGFSKTGETPSLSSECKKRRCLGDTASIGDVGEILDKPSFSKNLSDSASVGDVADILGSETQSKSDRSKQGHTPQDTSKSSSGAMMQSTLSNSIRRQSERNTASFGYIPDILDPGRGAQTSSSSSDQDDTSSFSLQEISSVDEKSKPYSVTRRRSAGTEDSKNMSADSTASLGDLADILGSGSGAKTSKSKEHFSPLLSVVKKSSRGESSSFDQTNDALTTETSTPTTSSAVGECKTEGNVLGKDISDTPASKKETGMEASNSNIKDKSSVYDPTSTDDIADNLGTKKEIGTKSSERRQLQSPLKKVETVSTSRQTMSISTSRLSMRSVASVNDSTDNTASATDVAAILGMAREVNEAKHDGYGSPASSSDDIANILKEDESMSKKSELPSTQGSGDGNVLNASLHDNDTASISDIADILGGMEKVVKNSKDEAETTDSSLFKDFDKEGKNLANSGIRESGDTASVTDVAKILNLSASSHKSSGESAELNFTTLEEQLESSKKSSTKSLNENTDTASIRDIEDILKKVDSSSKSSAKSPDDTNITASIGDIEDILGVGASRTNNVSGEEPLESQELHLTNCSNDLAKNQSFSSQTSLTLLRNGVKGVRPIASLDSKNCKENCFDKDVSLESKTETAESAEDGGKDGNHSLKSGNDVESPLRCDARQMTVNAESMPGTPSAAKRPQHQHHKSPMRLEPNSHVKPTPTKIEPSPRRIPNPKRVDSPARNTRSAKRRKQSDLSSPKKFGWKADEIETYVVESAVIVGDKQAKRDTSHQQAISDENISPTTPGHKKMKPVGILSSKKSYTYTGNKSFSQRSVIFGSPEAAEYHIGSPSVSLTPMPSSRVRALYAVPREGNLPQDESTSSSMSASVEQTVEIEADINVLVDKISARNMNESPALSPIATVDDHDGTINFQPKAEPSGNNLSPSASSTSLSTSYNYSDKEGMTVELEGGMDLLVENAISGRNASRQVTAGVDVKQDMELSGIQEENPRDKLEESVYSNQCESPGSTREDTDRIEHVSSEKDISQSQTQQDYSPAESVDMTDARSIASLNSRSDKSPPELSIHAQKLDFSPASTRCDISEVRDEGQTMELENDMTSLLAAVGVAGNTAPSNAEDDDVPPEKGESESKDLDNQNILFSVQDSPIRNSDSSPDPSRLQPISSRRFTLSPFSNVKDFANNEEILQESPDRTDESPDDTVLSNSGGKDEVEISPEEATSNSELPDLTFKELYHLVGLSLDKRGNGLHSVESQDALVYLTGITVDLDCNTFKKWGQLLQAVCAEVEKQTDDDGAASVKLLEGVANDPERFLKLQRILRKDGDSMVKNELVDLVEGDKFVILSDWKNWLATVLESFQTPISENSRSVRREADNVLDVSNRFAEYQDSLSYISDNKVRRARRKSLKRRKVSRDRTWGLVLLFSIHAISHFVGTVYFCVTR